MNPNVTRAMRWVLLAIGVVGFGLVLARTDVAQAATLIAAAGPWLVLALLPHPVQLGLDALAWRSLLASLGRPVRWRRLLAIRVSTEAVLMSMPAGSLVGESLKPYLLHRTDRVPAADTVASIGAKKYLLVFAQAAYVSIALVAGWGVLARHSRAVIGGPGLPYLVLGLIGFLLVLGTVLAATFHGGAPGARMHALLGRVPSRRFRAWIAARHEPFPATDRGFATIGRSSRRRRVAAFALLVGAWLVEAGETYLLLRVLGVSLDPAAVLVMEASVVSLRYLAFFVPAGLGVQDAGYLAFLGPFGVVAAAAGAFVILKRAKELVWVATGYLTLFALETEAA